VFDEEPPYSGGTRRIGDGVAVQSCGQQRAVAGWHQRVTGGGVGSGCGERDCEEEVFEQR